MGPKKRSSASQASTTPAPSSSSVISLPSALMEEDEMDEDNLDIGNTAVDPPEEQEREQQEEQRQREQKKGLRSRSGRIIKVREREKDVRNVTIDDFVTDQITGRLF